MTQPTLLLEREHPWSRLESALEAARRGQGRLVSVEGVAGIGKTSLVARFSDAHRADARLYVGACEHLTTPEPLGPLRDVARESAGAFAVSPTSPFTTFESLLRVLRTGRNPGVLVIEDLHWADGATLDLLRFLGRRIRAAPVLVVVTCRSDEPSAARLASLWPDLPRDSTERVELAPLSETAVAKLASSAGRQPHDVFEATRGNPFHVTEYLAVPEGRVPATLRDATLARASSLSPRARRTLECASIFPRQVNEAALRAVAHDDDSAGVEECLAQGMLVIASEGLGFRHELARRAVYETLTPLRRRDLHVAALSWLEGAGAGAAEIAHHAEQAGAVEQTRAYSSRAADEATALGAHREAVLHLGRALVATGTADPLLRAALLERQAAAAELSGQEEIARRAIDEAIDLRRRVDDVLGLGSALLVATRITWMHGESERAEQQCREALAVLEPHRETWQYAMALARQSQLDMLSYRTADALAHGREAMAMAERLGRVDIMLFAWNNVGAALHLHEPDRGPDELRAVMEYARRHGVLDDMPRTYANLTFPAVVTRRYDGTFDDLEEGIRVAVARDAAPLAAYLRGIRATALLDLGRTAEAIEEAESVVHGPYPRYLPRLQALVALSRARARNGVPGIEVIDDARTMPTSRRDVMRRVPIAVADAEAAWLGLERPGALDELRAALDAVLATGLRSWPLTDAALWLAILGEPPQLPPEIVSRLPDAYRLHIEGRWRDAATAWATLGCPFEQALALTRDDESAQREALAIFDRIGATAAAAQVRRALRASGARSVPRGPNERTRQHPAGLTRRQADVLALVADGLSNAEIARRLFISEKTAEHHVSAVLRALGAARREDAVEAARRGGLLPSA
jgi:DNA-binding CsgD family transcriptional regulator